MILKGSQIGIPAVYARGGTSRAILFHARDLRTDQRNWAPIFAAALGSPDPGGRQLDGLGCGISSLSKVAVVGPSSHPEADVDFTFAQVSVKGTSVSYQGNCGNISSAIGPFAVDEGLVAVSGDDALIRIHNTNTRKIIHARFGLVDGYAAVEGEMAIQGVAGTGAPIRLDFLDPGGAVTGRLLPSGAPTDVLEVEGIGTVTVSMVDAANPTVFVTAADVGLAGDETAAVMSGDEALLARLDAIRIAASLRMGVAATDEEARTASSNLPLVAIVSPCGFELADVRVRMISAGQPHKATPLTGAMCLAVAAKLPGTIVHAIIGDRDASADVLIAHASGVLPVSAAVAGEGNAVRAGHATVYRTARRLMAGQVFVPASVMAQI